MFTINFDQNLTKLLQSLIKFVKTELTPLVVIGMLFALIYQQYRLEKKDELINKLQDQRHIEDRKDAIDFRTSYMDLLKYLTDEKKVTVDTLLISTMHKN